MTHLELIEKYFPGRAAITLAEVAKVIPFSYKTLRNKRDTGRLEFPTFKAGKFVLVSIVQLAAWLDKAAGCEEKMESPADIIEKRRRGRPRNMRASNFDNADTV